ncbi:hypothetical protein P7H12_26095 [Paenibacillus larvae]|nr:hypothetical protein [Paenibacillus larvae]MDT2266385.1 hypothetical protein [Paenibacillus larvae]
MEKTYRLPLNLQLFAEGEGGRWRRWRRWRRANEGRETTKTFTQEELDKIVADRLARERKRLKNAAITTILKRNSLNTKGLAEEKRLADLSEQERLAGDG